jgi:hypothetical protein
VITKQRRRRLERRGRSRKADAKRRTATTLAARAPDRDEGTSELRRRKTRATTRPDIEVSGAGVLYGRGQLSAEQYDALGLISTWLRRAARVWGGKDGSCEGLWHAITGALISTGFAPVPVDSVNFGLGDQARRALQRACRTLDGSRALIIGLAEDRVPDLVLHVIEGHITPADEIELGRLRDGLDHLAGRRQRVAHA